MMNLTVSYADLLNITGLSERERTVSLRRIFDRDIFNNPSLTFLEKVIRPIKKEGEATMDTLFGHLTTKRKEVTDDGRTFMRSEFDPHRAIRLHWVRHHLDQGEHREVQIFSIYERDLRKRKDVLHTYIYNAAKKYVVVLQPQNSNLDYYLLSAYYLDEAWGQKNIVNKLKNRLPEVY